ncbi:MAG TPA: Eco47II family restriction endonuclease, partial [Candidatus Merdenecus merdavium]|nr:Eco47II family restriction endonuclease [Candidatus Merdenecus merdavium]
KRIRRVSLDQFYALVTNEEDSFFQMCMNLPEVIEKVVNSSSDVKVPEDTVLKELQNIAKQIGNESEELPMAMAVYMLGFSTYKGFEQYLGDEIKSGDATIKRIYEYAKRISNI